MRDSDDEAFSFEVFISVDLDSRHSAESCLTVSRKISRLLSPRCVCQRLLYRTASVTEGLRFSRERLFF